MVFFDVNKFPFIADLEAHWQEIQQEYFDLLSEELNDWHEREIYSGRWQVFGLYWQSNVVIENAVLCPNSFARLNAIPGLVNAGFSRMAPGCHIHPHRGYSHEVIRIHLGLTDNLNCALRVGDEVRPWTQGKCLAFDDMQQHEAWNKGTTERAVLLLDVERRNYFNPLHQPKTMPLPDRVKNADIAAEKPLRMGQIAE